MMAEVCECGKYILCIWQDCNKNKTTMAEDNFWTDELVKDFVIWHSGIYANPNPTDSCLDTFKKSKQQKQKDWEITQLVYPEGHVWNVFDGAIKPSQFECITVEDDALKIGYKIRTVKRLSDSEVFSVRDKDEEGEIISFDFVNGELMAWLHCGVFKSFKTLRKSKQPKRKDWEIVEYREKKTGQLWAKHKEYIGRDWNGHFGDGFEIHSVKRLSDNEVFSVGDVIEFGIGEIKNAPIDRFEIDYFDKSEICAYHSYVGRRCKGWQKVKQLLFVELTQDEIHKLKKIIDEYSE